MALPPPTCAEMRAFYPVLGAMELSAELGYTTTQCHVDNSFFALGEGRCCRCARTTVQMIREPDTQCTRAAYCARLVRYVLTTQRECTLLGRRWLRLRQIPPASVSIPVQRCPRDIECLTNLANRICLVVHSM